MVEVELLEPDLEDALQAMKEFPLSKQGAEWMARF
jgi:hypothetical protein